MKQIKDRRKARRIIFGVPVRLDEKPKVLKSNKGYISLETRDISSKGLFLFTRKRLKVNETIEILIAPREEKETFIFKAKVIWIAKKSEHPTHYPGIGVQFIRMSDKQKHKLQRFLHQKRVTYKDALALREMYVSLKKMAAQLIEIEERHKKFKQFKKAIDFAIKELDSVAHLLNREVVEIKKL